MELKYLIRHCLRLPLSLTAFALLFACSSDDPTLDNPDPIKPEVSGKYEVSYTMDIPEGNGNGTSSSPIEVEKGSTLDMSISQKSSYTDPDGTVYTCEPKAEIKLAATLDTVVVGKLEDLKFLKENPVVNTSSTGTNPVNNLTEQTFEIGGNQIVFNLSHEVYTYVNSQKQTVKMPYIKPNEAKFGSSGTTESRSEMPVVTGITVTPRTPSRNTIVRDSAVFDVNVKFSLELESKNVTTADSKRTLDFSVNYVGIVETTTELYDPETTLTYKWEAVSGTYSLESPFVKSQDSKTMEIRMKQQCSYTDEYKNTVTGTPMAAIRLSVDKDTVWASSLEELKEFGKMAEEATDAQSAAQHFGSSLQDVKIDWSYETAKVDVGGNTIQMPNYALKLATLKDFSVKEIGEEENKFKLYTKYEITATFCQEAVAENVKAETEAAEVEYAINYIGVVEQKLVDVEYFPGGEWVDPHHNIPLAFYPKVDRYRIYANGRRIGPDTFYDYGKMAIISSPSYSESEYLELDGGHWLNWEPASITAGSDSIYSVTQYCELSDFEYGELYLHDIQWITQDASGQSINNSFESYDFYNYIESLPGDESYSIAKDIPSDEYEACSLPTGWYFQYFICRRYGGYTIGWENAREVDAATLATSFLFYDQYLVIDGKRIDFKKLHNFSVTFEGPTIEDFDTGDKYGKIIKQSIRASYLGKNFYAEQTNIIYVRR